MKENNIEKPRIIILNGLSELKHKSIVDKLFKKCNNDTGATMNMVQEIVLQHKDYDPKGVEKFFIKIKKEVEETEGQDCLLVNDVLFDWKELKRPEPVGELIDLALNSMSNETSKNKLENMLIGKELISGK